ncbi:UBX domain-containing protein [Phthorimaea operculella]|nr:UBX domain-containing protein [Phthorimaea operculella]
MERDVCTRVLRAGPSEAGPSSANVVIKETQKKVEDTPAPSEPKPTPSVDEKVQKAKELIEAKRREKLAKEKELEIQKELERRATGQGVTELKKWQQEQELKNIQEERKREKMENNLARQRILEQIAQDRAERRARDQPQVPPESNPGSASISEQLAQVRTESRARDLARVVQPVVVQQPTASTPPPTAGDGGAHCRIQFKLPDGASHTAHFDPSGTLGDVRTYVADNLQMSISNFSLWTAFPRRELTEYEQTLRQLKLTPSAALLVLPRRGPTTVAAPSALSNIITFFTHFFTSFILEPSQQLYTWIVSRFSTDPPASTPTRPPAATPTQPPNTRVTTTLRRRGNVHRLGEERSPDDDNNTWNGNSTQQM